MITEINSVLFRRWCLKCPINCGGLKIILLCSTCAESGWSLFSSAGSTAGVQLAAADVRLANNTVAQLELSILFGGEGVVIRCCGSGSAHRSSSSFSSFLF